MDFFPTPLQDLSDQFARLPGIGEKTAMSLIQNAKSIEALYDDLASFGVKGATLTKLESGKDNAFLSKKLATIDRFVPMDDKFDSMGNFNCKAKELYSVLVKLDLKSIIKKLELSDGVSDENSASLEYTLPKVNFELIEDELRLIEILKNTTFNEFTYISYIQNNALQGIGFQINDTVYLAICSLLLSEKSLADALKPILKMRVYIRLHIMPKTIWYFCPSSVADIII